MSFRNVALYIISFFEREQYSFSKTQSFVPNFCSPKLSQWNFRSSNVKFPQNVLFPQFHFSSSSLNQNPNSPNFTFQHRRTYLSRSQGFFRSTAWSRCVLLLLPVCLHSAFGGYSNFWNRNGVFLFWFGLVLVLLLMDP